ncbi:ADP-ribosylglycohydrolase family protein [Vibrio alginolyticus]|uniref:ADP-ribosylglycohydrolase family protein n=1 Tax=Vibrio TaxID=662 RepID=UPI001BD214B2|nr:MULTISPECIES: ADP-ribosylglycohydrolase family protein [Vibrio]MBS9996654.1 ADP-ribosylglycohydrolase family protein [Vibrio alginolyticus]MDW1924715.1 ADP-ribosylglycohydrolase family protein [Vibrio sp. 947]
MNNTPNNKDNKRLMLDKAQGAIVGLALGDALGTSLEFCPKDSYTPLQDIVGGGPFHLKPGQWTDDTSMMLCLADSMLALGKHEARDQINRYIAWWQEGHNSVTGRCFDIGNTVSAALELYKAINEANAGSSDEQSAGNGSLMRLAPIPIFYSSFRYASQEDVVKAARLSSITTHAEQRAVEACQIMAWLIYQILDDVDSTLTKATLFKRLLNYWGKADIHDDLAAVVQGSFLTKSRKNIRGTGFVVQSLEAALWSFAHSDNFKDGVLLAANLGEDAETTAVIYGQLAGAFYGYSQLPRSWLEKLAWQNHIKEQATLLMIIPTLERLSSMLSQIASMPESSWSEATYLLLYDHGCILADYHWMDFPNRALIATDLRVPADDGNHPKRQFLERMSYVEGFQVITAIIRGDRFNEGLWQKFVEDGSLHVWLGRMSQFANNNDNF